MVSITSGLLHLPEGGGGTMTSGGTESILMSMLVNRERAYAKGIDRPQILAPESAHPAYSKAAHYFGMDVVRVPLDADSRADVAAARSLVTPDTAVVIASAFNYPYGVMDPVADLAGLAFVAHEEVVELIREGELFQMLEHFFKVEAALLREEVHCARSALDDAAARLARAGVRGKRLAAYFLAALGVQVTGMLAQVEGHFALEAIF